MALVRCRCGELCLGCSLVDTYSSHGAGSWKTFGGIKGAARSEVKLELRRQSYGVGEVARVAIYEYAVCVWG
jgi:hypothetical protein